MVDRDETRNQPGGQERRGIDVPPRRASVSARRRGLIGGLVAVLLIAAVPVVVSLVDGSQSGTGGRGDATRSVLAALGETVAAGSYDMTFSGRYAPGNAESTGACPAMASCVAGASRAAVDVSGHGTVNLDPYAMVAISNVSGLGSVTTYVNGTTVWELGGGNYGATPLAGGAPSGNALSGFAGSVEGFLGPGQGALAMIALANPTGYLHLEQAAVQAATPVGNGTVDGSTVDYYDVTVDVSKMAEAPNLTDEERITTQAALQVLSRAGYSGTIDRIGVDPAGFIREVTSTTRFSDGSEASTHTILSNFGCAAKVYTPDQPAPPVTTTAAPCTSPDTTTTTSEATTSTTSTSTPPSTSTSPVAGTPDTDAIRTAFLGWIDAQPKDAIDAYVEDYPSIQDSLRQGMAQHSPEDLPKYSGRVDSIDLVDSTHADVQYSILFDGTPQFAGRQGQAIKIDGVWKVSRDTVCALVAVGGITCPPRTAN
jgi:hypothetical protein